MMSQKQKKMISYELYHSKKSKEPDFLYNIIRKNRNNQRLQANDSNTADRTIKNLLIEKRIKQIKKIHKLIKVSDPEPYKKRTWISPLEANQKKQQILFHSWKKPQTVNFGQQNDKQKLQTVCNVLNLNKKMHLFGEFLFCEYGGKQNNEKTLKIKNKPKMMDVMHKQYSRLINSLKKSIVVCSKDSILYHKVFSNPLQNDKYFQKIMRSNDAQLIPLLIRSLCQSDNFTFTSFIKFYELFVWQQSSKQSQLQFVLNLLMSSSNIITYRNLSEIIDFLIHKISLHEQRQYLNGFNEVMKKLIFASQYTNCHSNEYFFTREQLGQSLLINQECISIFINVFYAE